MSITGDSNFPSSFKYKSVLEKGKPVHDKYDSFSIRHPAMDLSRRAKIFSPFDALKGFNEELFKTETKVSELFSDESSTSEEIP